MADIINLLKKQPDFYALTGASEAEIKAAEQNLDLQFAADYRNYVAAFGAASIDCHEMTGVCKSDRLSVVAVTQEERKKNDVPSDWYVIEQANIDGIVIWQDSRGAVYQTGPNAKQKKLCSSLAAYIEMWG